ncbi:hypothetical protein [[Clostridium] fimetarium]|uniref:DUF4179 domain-containing protein n=1 Tax=[Clostridium] fimetarium TaxID=99656 RepID=A0A1I0ME39_9FIRM|nr:hypothetical protein [[Clostridium] fimetarium]SEV85681.1 hypothetical protein SAMN05421659_101377 [[Clostridium] fimetarium]
MNIKRDLDRIHTKDSWIESTLSRVDQMEQEKGKNMKKKKSKMSIRVVVAAATITVLSVGTVFGYNYVQRTKNNNYESLNTAKSMDHLSGSADNGVTLETVGTTVSNKDISIECTSYKAEDHTVYIGLYVKTADGSALFDETENKVAVLARSRFDNISVAIDGEPYVAYVTEGKTTQNILYVEQNQPTGKNCRIQMVGDGGDPSCMQYELVYSNNEIDLSGKKLSFQVSKFGADFEVFSDIGFTADNVSVLLESGTPADESAFVVEDNAKKYEGIGYELLPGNNKIYFSDRYSGCYIDNFGYHKINGYNNTQTFYMTVVCDSDQAREALSKMTFQNIITGSTVCYEKKVLSDGRIQFTYNVNVDRKYSRTNDGIYIDTTDDYIQNLRLKKLENPGDERVITSDAELSFDVDLAQKDQTAINEISIQPELVVTSENNQTAFKVHTLKLDSMKLTIDGSMQQIPADMKMFGISRQFSPQIIMKNGNVVSAGNGGGGGNIYTGNYSFSWVLPSLVNPKEISQIIWHGTVLYQAQ